MASDNGPTRSGNGAWGHPKPVGGGHRQPPTPAGGLADEAGSRAARNADPIGPDIGGGAAGDRPHGLWEDKGHYRLTLQSRMLEIMDKRLAIGYHMYPSAFPFKTRNGVTWRYYDGPKNFDMWA
ncbi:hypothetical protein DL766_008154 [Monosporascus sp. MC13-8B]|uniref:Uncharacterized protein n=1 Tax=Monosporascus cannonballus TaxID=155416 RepID=A0ABY0GV80_9PEZI|nr:hypothetical protein DL762_010280 [Monosporascus cannonballus]RYO81455.1 hypothetical protein DL763_008582 [Monosporascus cannonballus]RYP20603.1 hypothetical protein DL766_008154 [Monosporascus sp. MC13-8B]